MASDRLSALAKHLILPEGIVATGWPGVRDRCNRAGIHFDRWQDDLGQAILAKRRDGLYAASVDGVQLSIPRQVGKTLVLSALVFGLAINQENLTVLWTAHRTRTSNETFNSMRGLANKQKVAPFFRAVRQANGQQEIEFIGGSRILFGARESGFGRGFAGVDVLVFDEAQILTQKALDDMVPAVNTSPNPLILRAGTPPKPTDPCEAFTDFRRQALAGGLRDGLYVEFSADEDASSGDRRQWARANPSFPHRTPESAILRMRRQLGEESFRREGLGIWDPDLSEAQVIPAAAWEATATDEAPPKGPTCWGVKFSPDGANVAVGATVKVDSDNYLCDGVASRPMSEGLDWLVEFLTDEERAARTSQVVIDGKAGLAWLVDQLRQAGVPARVIWTPSADQVIASSSMLLAGVKDGHLRHRTGEVLDAQVAGAIRRPIGSAGGFGFQDPTGDHVTLLEAVALSHWGARTTKRKPKVTRKRGGGIFL